MELMALYVFLNEVFRDDWFRQREERKISVGHKMKQLSSL
jgi:hypothetical protein